jgi:hypothetical protein
MEKPPIFGTWKRFYVVVLFAHLIVIGLMRWMTVYFS